MSRKKTDPRWRLIDHTADMRMEVRGADMKELFINAALGLTSILAPAIHPPPEREIDVRLEGTDHEMLLVDWLREVLVLHEVEGFVTCEARVETLSDSSLNGTLIGASLPPDQYPPDVEIKAVTYHGLAITRDRDGFVARVVFDV